MGWLRVVFVLVFLFGDSSSNKTRINIATFVPLLFCSPSSPDRLGYQEAMNLAADIINSRHDILPNHQLVLHPGDTCTEWSTSKYALYTLFKFLYNEPPKVMFIGSAYTKPTIDIATASIIWKVPQISYGTSTSEINGQKYLVSTSPTMVDFNSAVVQWIQYFGWKRVAIIHEYSKTLFTPMAKSLEKELISSGINVLALEGIPDSEEYDISYHMNKLKAKDTRIVIGLFYSEVAARVFCEAYKQDMKRPKYTWIIQENLPGRFFTRNNYKINCTKPQLKDIANGFFTFGKQHIRMDSNNTASGLNASAFMSHILTNHKAAWSLASYAFDALWTAALALNQTADQFNFTAYKYKNRTEADMLMKEIKQVEFDGLSGPVKFSSRGNRFGTVNYKQIREGSYTLIGSFDSVNDKRVMISEEMDKLWLDGRVPRDHIIRDKEDNTFSLALLGSVWSFNSLGLFASFIFLYFNIKHKDKVIRMSSPNLNNIIIVGGILCYLSVFLLGLDPRLVPRSGYGIICNVRCWTLSLGFTLSFGAMFSKTWRVHRIFTAAQTLSKVVIKDSQLYGIVLILLLLDLIMLVTWSLFSPFIGVELDIGEMEDLSQDRVVEYVLLHCYTPYISHFLIAMYIYKGILLVFGLFLAWETRKVQIPALNDSRFIGMSVYNVSILASIGVTISATLESSTKYGALYALTSLCIVLATTVTLCLVFIPKIIVLNNPNAIEAETKSQAMQSNHQHRTTLSIGAATCEKCKGCGCSTSHTMTTKP